jgi:hypothetical protein
VISAASFASIFKLQYTLLRCVDLDHTEAQHNEYGGKKNAQYGFAVFTHRACSPMAKIILYHKDTTVSAMRVYVRQM